MAFTSNQKIHCFCEAIALLLCLLAFPGYSQAQFAICSQATATINSQPDATALASCATISGSILVSSSAAGVISIDGPQAISGDLICQNAGELTSLGSSTIGSIGGSFALSNLSLLSTLDMFDLKSVKKIEWFALPALSFVTFPATVTEVSEITISNTFLSSMDGINPEALAVLNINNNNRLKAFSARTTSISSAMNIASNGAYLDLSFPDLIWAANITVRNASTFSVPALTTVNGSLGLYNNHFSSFEAPHLASIGSVATGQGNLALSANPSLSKLTLPALQSVGGAIQISNNSHLESISFPALANIGGLVSLSGNFSTPELPALKDVKGAFNVQSSSQIDCSAFAKDASSGVIQGAFVCKTTANPSGDFPAGNSTTSGSSTSSSSSSSTSTSIPSSSTTATSAIASSKTPPTTTSTTPPTSIPNTSSPRLSMSGIASIAIAASLVWSIV